MFSSASTDMIIENFSPINLDQLNKKAAMLERRDNKYVLRADVLQQFLEVAQTGFDALDLNGIRQFRYDTLYYDSLALDCFHDHQRGRRKRCKVRVRDYCDTQQRFLEIKMKDKRGSTVKKRLLCSSTDSTSLNNEQECFVGYCYRELYDDILPLRFAPMLNMSYNRMTLVAKAGGERLTIDNGLRFDADGTFTEISTDIFVVETKSRNGNGFADQYLRALHQHPTNRCSKYCVGIALTHPGITSNAFKSTIRKLVAAT